MCLITKKIFKFALGGMVPGDALKMIELASMNDPQQLQQGFNAFDECSSYSTSKFKSLLFLSYLFKAIQNKMTSVSQRAKYIRVADKKSRPSSTPFSTLKKEMPQSYDIYCNQIMAYINITKLQYIT
jgi:hypothetical protein